MLGFSGSGLKKEVLDYINKELHKGFDKYSIAERLVDKGHNPDFVWKHFHHLTIKSIIIDSAIYVLIVVIIVLIAGIFFSL